jgi:hypothetical protein
MEQYVFDHINYDVKNRMFVEDRGELGSEIFIASNWQENMEKDTLKQSPTSGYLGRGSSKVLVYVCVFIFLCLWHIDRSHCKARYNGKEYALGQANAQSNEAENTDILEGEYENLVDADNLAISFKAALRKTGVQFPGDRAAAILAL